jgi:hypothetical protein
VVAHGLPEIIAWYQGFRAKFPDTQFTRESTRTLVPHVVLSYERALLGWVAPGRRMHVFALKGGKSVTTDWVTYFGGQPIRVNMTANRRKGLAGGCSRTPSLVGHRHLVFEHYPHSAGGADMRMSHSHITQALGVLGLSALGIGAFAGCGAPTNPTSTSAKACAVVQGLERAGTATAGPHFTTVPFPSGSVGTLTAVPEINGIQYRTVNACVSGKTPAAITTFYSTEMVANEWADEAYVAPLGGDARKACPPADVCYFYLGFDTPRYVVLEPPASSGTATTWTLQLIAMPYGAGHKELGASNNVTDLDGGIPEGEVDDLLWDGATLSMLNGAQRAILGQRDSLTTLSYDDLSGATYSSAAISADDLPVGTVIAVHTKDDHYAKARVTTIGGGMLDFDYLTYPYKL